MERMKDGRKEKQKPGRSSWKFRNDIERRSLGIVVVTMEKFTLTEIHFYRLDPFLQTGRIP